MHFSVHPPEALAPLALERACFVGADLVPWPCRFRRTPGGFDLERESGESGNLRLPWPVAGHGELMVSTASLMERSDSYHLEVELARGKLNQVRNQLADWQTLGLAVPQPATTRLEEATRHFASAATRQQQPDEAAREALLALEAGADVARLLGASYAEQAIAARRRQGGRIDSWLAAGLGGQVPSSEATRLLQGAFSTALVPISWYDVEAREDALEWKTSDEQLQWCARQQIKAMAGPLLRFDRWGFPDWLCLWAGNPAQLTRFAAQYVRRVVDRYRGQVQAWYAVGRLTADNGLDLDEEHTLRMAMESLAAIRQADPQTPILLGIDQPWADHQGHRELDLSPWHFTDALVRSDLGLSGIVLEWPVGYHPGGVPPRDLVELSRILDFWSLLGLPLYLNLSVPSGGEADPLARSPAKPLPATLAGGLTPAAQKAWVETYVPLILAKPAVRGVIWHEVFDAAAHELANGGLFDLAGQPKPALAALNNIRRTNLS